VSATVRSPTRTTKVPESHVIDLKLNGFKVLVAEDNSINRQVMQRMLDRIGFTDIVMAHDGQEALSYSNRTTLTLC
jgi:PleD family two-component response regulator